MRAVIRRLSVVAILLCGVAPPSLSAPLAGDARPAPPADVERVSFTESADGRTHTVRIHLSSSVEAFSADARAGRLDVVLHGAHLAPSVRQEGAEWPVESYRVTGTADRVALSFRVAGGVEVRAAPDRDSDDLVLTFSTAGRRVASAGWGIVRDRPARSAAPRRGVAFGAPDRTGPTRTLPARRAAPPATRSAPPASDRPARTAESDASTQWPARRTTEPLPAPARPEPPRVRPTAPAPTRRPEPATPPMRTVEAAPSRVDPPVIETIPTVKTPVAAAPPVERPAAPAIEIPNASRWQLDTVVLDAGHGGADYGARANGTSDKEVAFGVVSRLGPMIERELGVRVVYTRDDDTFYELRERGRIANRAGGKLFISVHANAAGSSSAQGTETFFLAPHREKTAKEVMDRENSVIQLESRPELYEDFDDEGDILQAMAMSAYQEESQALAGLIEREFVESGRKSRGVKQAGFIVLWAASMPAVLVETGFITNPDEARLLSSDAGLDATAEAIFRAVRTYKESYERGLRPQGG